MPIHYPVGAGAGAGSAIVAGAGGALAAGAVGATILLGRYIYRRMTEKHLPVYSEDELRRHQILCAAYRDLCIQYRELAKNTAEHRDVYPVEWVLEEVNKKGSKKYRPLYDHDFKESVIGLQHKLDQLNELTIFNADIHQSAKAMLNAIIKLFNSLSKRKYDKLKPGSVEGMFFAEFSHWVVQYLPCINFKTEEDLAKLRAMKEFCEKVYTSVLIPESNARRNNPLNVLQFIREDIDGIIGATKHLIQSVSLSERIDQLDNAVLGMAAQLFHVLYLMIQNEDTAPEKDLPIVLFLNEDQLHRKKMHAFKQQRLSGWLQETLMLLGIARNDFKNTITPSLDMIERHLAGECARDFPCTLTGKLIDATHSSWGHWPFYINEKTVEQAEDLLLQKRELCRDIARLYYLHDLLAHVRKVAPVYGEDSLYGTSTGDAAIKTLMLTAEALVNDAAGRLTTCYEDFHHVFEDKRTKSKIAASSPAYVAATLIADQFTHFEKQTKRVNAGIAAIRAGRQQHPGRLARAREGYQQLLQQLVDLLIYHNRTTGEDYGDSFRLMQSALTRGDTAPAGLPAVMPSGTRVESWQRLPKSGLPLYHILEEEIASRVGRHAAGLPDSLRAVLVAIRRGECLSQPKRFYSLLHQVVYHYFLVRNQGLVDLKVDFFSFFLGVWPTKMSKFRELYDIVNTLMKCIYSRDVPRGEFADIDQLLVDQFLEKAMIHYYFGCYQDSYLTCFTLSSEPALLHRDNGDGSVSVRWNPSAKSASDYQALHRRGFFAGGVPRIEDEAPTPKLGHVAALH